MLKYSHRKRQDLMDGKIDIRLAQPEKRPPGFRIRLPTSKSREAIPLDHNDTNKQSNACIARIADI